MSTTTATASDVTRARHFTMDRKSILIVGALVLYAVLATVIFDPLSPWTGDYLSRAGIGDPAQMVWFLAYTPHALAHGLDPFWSNLIDYPTGVNLADNTSVPLLGVLAWPVTATLGPVSAFNLLLRLGIFLSASSLFLVLHRWVASRFACFIGGLLFGFGPYIVGQSISNTHINLLFVPLFPLLVLVVDEIVARQCWSWKTAGVALGLLASAQMMIAPELLSDFGVVALVVLIFLAFRYRNQVRSHLAYAIRAVVESLVIYLVLCGFQIWTMLFGKGHLHGAVYAVSHLQSFHNSLVELFLPTQQQLLTTARLSNTLHLPTRDLNELGGYLSIPLAVVLVLTVIFLWRRYLVVPLGIGTLVAIIISMGSSLKIGNTNLVLPEKIFTFLPLLKSTVPDRFALLTLLGASMLFAIGIDRALVSIRSKASTAKHLELPALAVVVLVVLVAMAPRLPIREQRLIWPTTIGGEIAAHVASGAVVLTYPYPMPPLNQAMAWQAEANFSFHLLGGYATVPNPQGDGQEWPLLQRPSEIQSYLGRLELGHRSRFPKVAKPTNATELCAYVREYGVTDFVIFKTGINTPVAAHYLGQLPQRITFSTKDLTISHLVRARSGPFSHCVS